MVKDKHSKVYLRICRWCNRPFFSEKHNTLYCSYKHRYESILESNREWRQRNKEKTRRNKLFKKKGTIDLKKQDRTPITYLGRNIPGSEWYDEQVTIHKLKKSTFNYPYSKGKQKGPSCSSEGHSPYHHHVTEEDLHHFSVSYLKENNVKCPECGNKKNEIIQGLVICRKCGMVLKAPPVHPGFEVYDLVPTWKLAPTVQDLTMAKKSSKVAFKLAKTHYWEQVGILDPEPDIEHTGLDSVDSQEDWRAAWKYYKKNVTRRKEYS